MYQEIGLANDAMYDEALTQNTEYRGWKRGQAAKGEF